MDSDPGGPSQAHGANFRRPFAIDQEIRDLGAVQRRDIETFKDFVQAVLHSKFSLLADYLRYFSDESDDFDIYNLINSIRNLEQFAVINHEDGHRGSSAVITVIPASASDHTPLKPKLEQIVVRALNNSTAGSLMNVINQEEYLKDTFLARDQFLAGLQQILCCCQ